MSIENLHEHKGVRGYFVSLRKNPPGRGSNVAPNASAKKAKRNAQKAARKANR